MPVVKRILYILALAAACLLTGCGMLTVDEMYSLPKRSEAYHDLQAAIDESMTGLSYCAPLSGENQQTVQMADLDGDGVQEYLLFAKGSAQMPLQILIFTQIGESYALADTIECNGSAFELVEYVQMDGRSGAEIVVGRQLSDQVLRSVSVYTFSDGRVQQLLSTNYSKFITCDLDSDTYTELLVLRPGQTDTDNGVAELYGMENGTMERSNEARLSGPTDRLKRIITGKLHGGTPAVFVGSSVDESAIITDVYALVQGQLTNVSLSSESGNSVQTLRNYYVYADDIDNDGEVELPDLITMKPVEESLRTERQDLIRWYAIDTAGGETVKMHTYHDFVGGWYLRLDDAWASRVSVTQLGNAYDFYLWSTDFTHAEKIFTVYALTGQDRESQALTDNRFVLYKGESTVYAAHMEVASGSVKITQDDLKNGFHLIRQDWKTGEM